MDKYRIIEITCYGGRKVYEVQKRRFGFLWWFNWLNTDAYETGIFDELADAEAAVGYDMYVKEKRVVKTYK